MYFWKTQNTHECVLTAKPKSNALTFYQMKWGQIANPEVIFANSSTSNASVKLKFTWVMGKMPHFSELFWEI